MKLYEKLTAEKNNMHIIIEWIKGYVGDSWYLDVSEGEPVIRRGSSAVYSMSEFKRLLDWGNKLFDEVDDDG